MKKHKSTILSPEAHKNLGHLLTAVTALLVVTCASAVRTTASAVAPPTDAAPPPPAPSAAPPAGSAVASRPAPVAAPTLSRTFAALEALERGERKQHVRVLWFGDSHTAADFWPHAVRSPLQKRFGVGGPGFVYVGLQVYRHGAVSVEREGKWRRRPRSPSLWKLQDDGVFGLGGMRVIPMAGDSRFAVELATDTIGPVARWEVVYRLPTAADSFRIAVTGGKAWTVDAKTAETRPDGIARHVFETDANAKVVLGPGAGAPEIFGIVLEGKSPGVVVDTLGINGARIGTPLAWNEETWVAEVRQRDPSLIVLAYGTNEVGDAVAPHRYGPEYEALVARVKKAAPEVDCWIIGPTDRATTEWKTHPRVHEIETVQRRAAERLGCAYTSAVDVMGGPGSLEKWANESPPLATNDRVHLTSRGYVKLGDAIAGLLLEAYDAYTRQR